MGRQREGLSTEVPLGARRSGRMVLMADEPDSCAETTVVYRVEYRESGQTEVVQAGGFINREDADNLAQRMEAEGREVWVRLSGEPVYPSTPDS